MLWWGFEGIIWIFLVIVGAALVEIITKNGRKILKRRTLLLAVVVLFFSWSLVFYGSFIEPKILLVKNETVDFGNITQPLRVALLSDFHIGPYKGADWVEEFVKKTNEQKPDLILLLGDYVFGYLGDVEDLNALQNLSAPLGVYAVLGNHDYDSDRQDEVKNKLEALGIKVLFNSSEEIKLSDGTSFCLAGLNDLWNSPNLGKTLADCPAEENILLMSHNPDAILFDESHAVNLIVSGHTHGGQIRLPFVGPMSFVPTVLPNEYSKGLFDFAGTPFFVTSGLGETGPRARLFSPPEIVILRLN